MALIAHNGTKPTAAVCLCVGPAVGCTGGRLDWCYRLFLILKIGVCNSYYGLPASAVSQKRILYSLLVNLIIGLA
jgi:hypothetical protein